ncbi:MAG: hypothetical protein FJ317_00105 [SAR202 cluster bacterium]|nr:hypothetical protein [SAR202 cluster bacterium]
MVTVEIRESEIEDIFAQYPSLLRKTLRLPNELTLIARQMILPSGRLDLLYSSLSNLLLVELKVESFRESFLKQILSYRADLTTLQAKGEFVQGSLTPILLCTSVNKDSLMFARQKGVEAHVYDPAEVLIEFYNNAPLDTKYLTVRPSDKGIWRIGLINESLYLLEKPSTASEISLERNRSPKTMGNQLAFAVELDLVQRDRQKYLLTPRGRQYVEARDKHLATSGISKEQANLLRKFIITNPFYSGVSFGILTMTTCIFELSKNTYPVPLELVSRHFINAAGLRYRWDSTKAVDKGVKMYSNYAIDLGLVGKIGDSYFVTPGGLNFVLLLNMHKSLKLIENSSKID